MRITMCVALLTKAVYVHCKQASFWQKDITLDGILGYKPQSVRSEVQILSAGLNSLIITRIDKRVFFYNNNYLIKEIEMKITKLTFLGFFLNGALGSGKYDDISIDEVKDHIENKSVFNFLKETLGHDIDLSILTNEDKEELLDEWARIANAVDEDRKMAVTKNGLCLLVAYLFEGIQQRVMK